MTLIGDDAGGGVIFHLSALFQSGLQKTATQVIMMTSEKHPAPHETQGSGISNFPKSAQPAEMYYPLDIATKLVQKYYPGVDLLSYANTAINIDKICLLVDATKDDVEVITVDRHENSVLPVLTHAPDMFVLGIRESKSVELRGNDCQCDFTRGYTFSSGQPVETHPYDNAQPAELQYATNNWVWRIINKFNKQTHIVDLARDCLFVLHLELAKQFPLIENESQPESTLLVETLKVEIPDLKEPVVALATHQVAGLPHEMQGDEPSVQTQPRSSESRENMGMFSYTNVGALMLQPMPRTPPVLLDKVLFLIPRKITRSKVLPFFRINCWMGLTRSLLPNKSSMVLKLSCQEPQLQWCARALKHRYDSPNSVAMALSATKHSWSDGETERFIILSEKASVKLIGATVLLKEFGTGRMIRLKPLKFKKRLWDRVTFSADNKHKTKSCSRFRISQIVHLAGVCIRRVPVAPEKPIQPLTQNNLPETNYLALKDAAIDSEYSETELLKFASNGEHGDLKLCIPIPDDKEIRPFDKDNECFGTSFFNPERLILEPWHCRQIIEMHRTDQSDFKRCYVAGRNHPSIKPPGAANLDRFQEDNYTWRALDQGERYHIPIIQADLQVSKYELNCFKRERPAHPYDLEKFEPKEYTSDKLIRLNQVAKRVWGKTYTEEEKYPDNQSVANMLKETDWVAFSVHQADRGAIIIRPEYANGKPQPSKQKGYITDEFKALVAASKEHFEGIDLKNIKAYPKPKTVKAWLIKNYDFKDYLAETGASIICPEGEDGDE